MKTGIMIESKEGEVYIRVGDKFYAPSLAMQEYMDKVSRMATEEIQDNLKLLAPSEINNFPRFVLIRELRNRKENI